MLAVFCRSLTPLILEFLHRASEQKQSTLRNGTLHYLFQKIGYTSTEVDLDLDRDQLEKRSRILIKTPVSSISQKHFHQNLATLLTAFQLGSQIWDRSPHCLLAFAHNSANIRSQIKNKSALEKLEYAKPTEQPVVFWLSFVIAIKFVHKTYTDLKCPMKIQTLLTT